MHEITLILALLAAVAVLATLARTARVPYPVLLLLGGLVLAAIPAVPNVELAPELVFLFFLPPLIYVAGFDTSIREIKAQFHTLLSLAVGLVLATTVAVALVAHLLIPDLPWAVAFALGAIVSPPDAVAATTVFKGLGVPRRLVTLLEGESLFNDATALVAYQAAVAAAATATFSLSEAAGRFVVAAVGGVLVGAAIGLAVSWLRSRIEDPPVEITISLLTPFVAYLPAEALGLSGVLATVTAGLVVGWYAPRIMHSDARVRGRAVWEFFVFMLTGLVFILIGLQLSTIVDALSPGSLVVLIAQGAAISLTVIAVRMAWVFGSVYIKAMLSRLELGASPPPWQETFVLGWAGMRGVVSLATALALPLFIEQRDELIFITFCVILATLVGQGLSLPWLIRVLGVGGDGGAEHEEFHARAAAAEAAVARIDELAEQWPDHQPLIETLRVQYSHRASHLGEHNHTANGDADVVDAAADQELLEHRQIRTSVIDAERDALLSLRQSGAINDEVWRRIERDIDLEELRMEA